MPRSEIARKLGGILAFRGVSYRTKRVALDALAAFGATNCDIVDCLLAARARGRNAKVYSFDEDFTKLGCSREKPG